MFFHSVVNQRQKQGYISRLGLSDGQILENAKDVHFEASKYFQEFLTMPTEVEYGDLLALIDKSIFEEDNSMLCLEPSVEEVKEAIFSIPKQSSLGTDAFGFGFFMSCWDVIKEDVIEAAREFFRGSPLPRFYSSSFIVLILKIPDPSSFDKFRPISLCSVAYKAFYKIIVTLLTRVIHKLVSYEQDAFVLGRSIFENIILA